MPDRLTITTSHLLRVILCGYECLIIHIRLGSENCVHRAKQFPIRELRTAYMCSNDANRVWEATSCW